MIRIVLADNICRLIFFVLEMVNFYDKYMNIDASCLFSLSLFFCYRPLRYGLSQFTPQQLKIFIRTVQ